MNWNYNKFYFLSVGDHGGRLGSMTYFEAPEYSSVFTKVNHLYFYDEDEDIEQIRQKIDSHVTSINQIVKKPKSKKMVWKKFEMDKKANEETHERILGDQSQRNDSKCGMHKILFYDIIYK